MRRFKFIDLFAGIGGMRIPFEEIGGECIFTSEIDKYSKMTYDANFKESKKHIFAGDITKIESKDVPSHDVLLGGFPCQSFSIVVVGKLKSLGRPMGLENARGTLFYDLVRIMEYHKPRIFLLENVENILYHDNKRTMAIIMHTLEGLGYTVHTKLINSAPWVPQKRKRVFFVGFRDPTNFNFNDLKIPRGTYPVLDDILEEKVESKYTIPEGTWKYLSEHKKRYGKGNHGFGFNLVNPYDVARTLTAHYARDGREILLVQENDHPRKLTPRECARLMGFDGPQESNFKIPVADSQAYKQFGNAVVVPVIRAIAELLKPYIYGYKGNPNPWKHNYLV